MPFVIENRESGLIQLWNKKYRFDETDFTDSLCTLLNLSDQMRYGGRSYQQILDDIDFL